MLSIFRFGWCLRKDFSEKTKLKFIPFPPIFFLSLSKGCSLTSLSKGCSLTSSPFWLSGFFHPRKKPCRVAKSRIDLNYYVSLILRCFFPSPNAFLIWPKDEISLLLAMSSIFIWDDACGGTPQRRQKLKFIPVFHSFLLSLSKGCSLTSSPFWLSGFFHPRKKPCRVAKSRIDLNYCVSLILREFFSSPNWFVQRMRSPCF